MPLRTWLQLFAVVMCHAVCAFGLGETDNPVRFGVVDRNAPMVSLRADGEARGFVIELQKEICLNANWTCDVVVLHTLEEVRRWPGLRSHKGTLLQRSADQLSAQHDLLVAV